MSKPNVSLVIADTESYALANNAIEACIARFDFSAVHVFTDAPQYWPQHRVWRVPKIGNIEDYNRIVLSQFAQRVESDYCIVAQYDGFILNADAFSPEFYKFDYIGAVWPDYADKRVGNGGFSWRSRRLLDAVASLSHMRADGEAEDLFICRTLRPVLEQRFGCVFADEAVAQQFSYEIVPSSRPAFGFHGIFNLPLVYRNNLRFLVENLPQRLLRARLGFLQYGVNQLPVAQQQEFGALVAVVL